VFFVLRRERHHPGYRPDPDGLRRSVLWSLYSVSGKALLMLPIEVLILSGASEVYFSVAEHGWPYLFGSIFAVLAVAETSIYWIHRALHTRFLYRHLHVFHHRFREPTPLASLAFHPLDSPGRRSGQRDPTPSYPRPQGTGYTLRIEQRPRRASRARGRR
jgi:Delta7-sterol 5-desaturase